MQQLHLEDPEEAGVPEENGIHLVEVIEEGQMIYQNSLEDPNHPQLDLIVMLLQVRKDNVQIIASYS